MLLSPDPLNYYKLAGLENVTKFLVGKRIDGPDGNAAFHRYISEILAGRREWSDTTDDRLLSYFESGKHPAFAAASFPNDLGNKLEKLQQEHITPQLSEFWSISLDSLAYSGISLERVHKWCPWLADTSTELVRLYHAGETANCLRIISILEYSNAKSIRLGQEKLRNANSPEALRDAMVSLSMGTLLFVFACFDADTTGTEDGSSFYANAMPRIKGAELLLPMNRWMNAAQRLLKAKTKKETTNILLKFRDGDEDTIQRDGKRYWSGKKCPSSPTFSQMIGCAKKYCPEQSEKLDALLGQSVPITFLHNLYWELENTKVGPDGFDPIFLFSDYDLFYSIARNTRGPVPD